MQKRIASGLVLSARVGEQVFSCSIAQICASGGDFLESFLCGLLSAVQSINMEGMIAYLADINAVSICLRVALSMICGGVIGIERSRAHQVAGMRTYMLVCLGAAVVMLTGQYMQNYFGTGDPARLGAQVISGIGFLGAGGIISSREKIRGLTTAAGLWASACIGLSIGIGFYAAAIVFTIAVFLTLSKFRKIERYINTKFHKDDA